MAMHGTLQVRYTQLQGIEDMRIDIYRYPEDDGSMSIYVRRSIYVGHFRLPVSVPARSRTWPIYLNWLEINISQILTNIITLVSVY